MRTTFTLAGMLICALLLSACNGAVSSSGPKPTATFGPAVQTRLAEANRPRPTRTPTPESAAQVATEPPPTATPRPATPTPQPTVEPTPSPSEEALLLALLTLDEMPEGWIAGEVITYDPSFFDWFGDDGIFYSPDDDDYCSWDFGAFMFGSITYFDHEEHYASIGQNVILFANDHQADSMLVDMLAALEHCPDSEEVLDGEIVRMTVRPLDYAPLGDRSGAFHVTESYGEDRFDSVIAAFRIDRTVTMVWHDAETWESGPVEEWVTESVMIRAFEKLDALREIFDSLERPAAPVI